MTIVKKDLTLQDVSTEFRNYNFIIETSNGVFDTSEYNLWFYGNDVIQTSLQDMFQGGGIKTLALATNSKYKGPGTNKLTVSTAGKGIEKGVVIFDYTVQKIYVKSKRNFLENQLVLQYN